MDYSKTVNLPRTDFPMKAELARREPDIQEFWEEINLYEKTLEKPAPRGRFILHDGPPYSNGDIHIGHALNKLLKDFIVRYKRMAGYQTPFIPGWDNHGLPIEQKVSEGFRRKHQTPTLVEMRKACRDYAAMWVDKQREQFKRLGVTGDWEQPYLTMDYGYEATIVKVFGELAEQGYIYRGLKPIHWCVFDETALAEAEIEYAPHVSPSIYVRFPLIADPNGLFDDRSPEHSHTIIWTTTPWTIPANLAVAVHPDYDYAFVDVGEDRYLIAAELVGKTMAAIGVEHYCVVKTVKGSELEGMIFNHPIYNRKSLLVFADYVTLEEGTGVVHTAPGHGREDFETGQRYGIEPLNPVNDRGVFTKEAGQFEGLHIMKQGNRAVIDALKEADALLAESEIEHSYPHCWRCHNPVVFRTTVQWFMSIDHEDLRNRMLKTMDDVAFYPAEAKNRLRAMVENSPDWCLSRQRSWGVGIPVFYCEACGEAIMTRDTFDAVYRDVLENGSDSWYEKDPKELLGPDFRCPNCGGSALTKETDVLDVWFDSGSSSRAVVENRLNTYPPDLYCEGSDQHRGWFNKSLVIGVATKSESPFSQLVSHGFVLDAEGRAMSKSIGNVIAPQQIIKDVGADVLRLFVSSVDYSEDVRIGPEILKRVTDAYRRLRNTFRFLLSNLYDFDPERDRVAREDMLELDRWILHRLQEVMREIENGYEDYEFHRVFHTAHNFAAVDLSSMYLDIIKDRLYASAPKDLKRRSAQTALYDTLMTMVSALAPILAYTMEEVWRYLSEDGRPVSVHLSDFPGVRDEFSDRDLAARWQRVFEFREEVYRAIEQARQSGVIRKPLESRVFIAAPGPLYEFLKEYESDLPAVLIVSQVVLEKAPEGQPLAIEVTPPEGRKCERCWLVLETVGKDGEHPMLCSRCAEVVSEMEPIAG